MVTQRPSSTEKSFNLASSNNELNEILKRVKDISTTLYLKIFFYKS